MTTLDVTLARIRSRRREIDPVRVVQLLVMALPWVLGWTARKVVLVSWVVVSFLWAALDDGWTAGSRPEDDAG